MTKGGLSLSYRLNGPIHCLRIPAPLPPEFVDGLWEHTCFEVFVAVAGKTAYREFNFAPSGEWASYAFREYREREEFNLTDVAPHISVHYFDDRLELDAVLAPALLTSTAPDEVLQLGLSAVIETADGNRSYWALAHPAAQPDFHNRATMHLTLATDNTKL